MINEHAAQWLGFPVQLFDAERSEKGVTDYATTIYRLALDWDAKTDFSTLFSRFLSGANSGQTPAIIIGQYHGDDPEQNIDEVVQLLVSARAKLPRLAGIFIGDILSEENEISWIVQGDVSPLWAAYPALEHLRIRGTNNLTLGRGVRHEGLKSLVIETGGLPPEVIAEVVSSQFPNLEHLELWLGTPSYGGDATVADLEPILQGGLFPKLKSLGLRDSEIADDVAEALASARIASQLEHVDLSLGLLSDRGAQALVESSGLKQCKSLDLHHHYLSDVMMAAVKATFPKVNLDDAEGDDCDPDDRYVSVSE